MIDFSKPKPILMQEQLLDGIAKQIMRPISRKYDDAEVSHERPWEYINAIWQGMQMMGFSGLTGPDEGEKKDRDPQRPPIANQMLMHVIERLSYGDAGIYLSTPGGALGGAAVAAAGTKEQKRRFLARFNDGAPKWGAMAMTEPHAGSDTAAIRTRATLSEDGKEWILNGEKIFVTGGLMAAQDSDGFVVVWATVDPTLGRAGMKPFVVEANTPGMTVTKLEKKLGIRASDTAAINFADCRIPFDNVLGDPELATPDAIRNKASKQGFKGAMATFDATRPAVAASAIGIGNAALEFVEDWLAKQGVEIRYGAPYQQQSAIERDLIRMAGELKAAWLLTLKAAWLMDQGQPNTLEASMCKVKAGEAVTWVTQKAVEIMGPEGYSTEHLVEKWMRDAKINDIYEGTGQINRMIVARNILGYRSSELR
ncbi:MAG: acyl-CoA dehydrogenase family protein [Anaerolineales bacterium]|nr:acyl-CoA dehydrogenase family protein [Anaerolineales bacterium]MCB9129211.1 acyl-CoA dehydrogenase family protein [Ardenticatenales bacterium]